MPRDNAGWGGRGCMTRKNAGRCSGNSRNTFNNYNNQSGLLSSFTRWFSGSRKGMSGNRGGAGAGRGMGRGMRQGMNRGVRNFNDPYSGFSDEGVFGMNYETRNPGRTEDRDTPKTQILNKERALQEADQLRERARRIQEELQNVRKKIDELESKEHTSKAKVIVDKDLCTGCGICEKVCPRRAVTVRESAEIDQKLCTLCGQCINECPANALQII